MKRESLSEGACVRKRNRKTRKHPRHRKGRHGAQISDGLQELQPPEDREAKDPQDMAKSRADPDLQRVRRDSAAAVDQKRSYPGVLTRSRMLAAKLRFRLSREAWRSRLLQRSLRLLYRAILESRLRCDSWPADVASLIGSHCLTDPWKPGESLQVKYTAPTNGTGDLSREHVLAEYVREGQWNFALYADGHQETRRL